MDDFYSILIRIWFIQLMCGEKNLKNLLVYFSDTIVFAADLKSHVGELKTSAHPVARRIWMSSCRPLDPVSD